MKYKFYILFSLFLVSASIFSQDMNYAVLDRKNIVHLLGYSRVAEIMGKKIIFTASVTDIQIVIDKRISFSDGYGGKIGTLMPIVVGNNLIITPSAYFSGLRNSNQHFNYTGFNSNTNITVGYYKLKWFIAVAPGIDIPIARHYSFSSEYYENIYKPWVHKGWNYNNKLSAFPQIKFMYGYTIKQRADLIIGYEMGGTGRLLSLDNIVAGINYRFGKKIATVEIQE